MKRAQSPKQRAALRKYRRESEVFFGRQAIRRRADDPPLTEKEIKEDLTRDGWMPKWR